MLSIGSMQSDNGRYYLELAREDYYLEGGEPPGRWWGNGAKALNLHGDVDRDSLSLLLKGFSPAAKPLTQNAGRAKRQSGWDLTFSAPKSVSVLWSVSDAEMRRKILAAHKMAVKAALSYLENEASLTRRGRGGVRREAAEIIAALFGQVTSRAMDPLIHTHCLLLNVATRKDGTTGSLFSPPLYRHKMAAGVTYRVELAHQLEKTLGLRCVRTRTWFEVAGVPKNLRDHFSKRRKAIKERLGEWGLETASAAAYAALDTRCPKNVVAPRKTLFQRWRKTAEEFSFGPKEAFLLRGEPPNRSREALCRKALQAAVDYLTERESHFAERDLVRRTMEAAQGSGLSSQAVLDGVKHALHESGKFIELGQYKEEVRYTTAEILKTEKSMQDESERSQSDTRFIVRPTVVDHVIERCSPQRSTLPGELKHHAKQLLQAARRRKTERIDRKALRASAKHTIELNDEQVEAVRHLTQTPGRVKVLAGLAGTGKTTTLAVCREVWEKSGFTVLGGALSGRAAHELALGSGIPSDTLAMLQKRLDPTVGYQFKHHAKQLLRAARHKSTYKLERLKIDKKTVLVIDEAGMVGTKLMAYILKAVHRQGGKVVLVGDEKQLQPIEIGGPFRALAEQLGYACLESITRQRDERDRQLVQDMMSGNAQAALTNLADRGLVSVSQTRKQAIEKLVADWSKDGAAHPEKVLIFACTNEDVHAINRLCQKDRILAGVVNPSKAVAVGDDHLFSGDRVMFTKRSRELGLENGWTGTVLSVNRLRKRIAAKLDNGKRVVIPLNRYKHKRGLHKGECAVRLGYATTTHKGQGATVDKAYVLAGGYMQHREITYVQISRARQETRLYTDEAEAGKDLKNLAQRMNISRAKDLAHDVIRQQHHQRSLAQGL